MGRSVRLVVLFAVLSLVVFAVGCGRIAEKAAETAVEGATGVKVEDDGDSVTIETDEGTVEVGSGEGDLPEDFPDDVPVYDGAIDSHNKVSTPDGVMWSVVLSTSDNFDNVVSWYKAELSSTDWAQEALLESSAPEGATFVLKKGEQANAAIGISVAEDSGKTEISLTVTEHDQ
jgi:hypothetical protein